MTKKRSGTKEDEPLFASPPPPDFETLLRAPSVKEPLPSKFDPHIESEHLKSLWKTSPQLHEYEFQEFVHAGGSGMVFRVQRSDSPTAWAMKLVRAHLYSLATTKGDVATTLSPVSEAELKALQTLSHPHVVHLFDAIGDNHNVFAICTSYVEKPMGLDEYLRSILQKAPARGRGIEPFSPQRLDGACTFLLEKCREIGSALQHMHSQRIFHFDVKPTNILVSSASGQRPVAILTDMGACVHGDSLVSGKKIRVHFTWTYAHPELKSILSDPGSISGQGLKASATIDAGKRLDRYDLFALGKSLQELLAVLENEFRERCYASYGFRFLHVIACLLLDGHNAPGSLGGRSSTIVSQHGRRFVDDVALDYPPAIFGMHRIGSADELVERLDRYGAQYSRRAIAPELDEWQPEVINSVVHSPAPFSKRVSAIFNHPCFRRLKDESQLGWVREVFPGATHDRWSHSLGVFSALVSYYNSLLSDPEVPTFRILTDANDASHAFVAAILHDLGQTTFGHDFEEACPYLFSHYEIVERLVTEKHWGLPTLAETIKQNWPDVDLGRVMHVILGHRLPDGHGQASGGNEIARAVDGVAADAINGPIDADKLDYLLRDSIACGVPYGHGMDVDRFLRALTVTATDVGSGPPRLALAYKSKGRAAVASVLLARYQMWGAVYWHHTFRCIQAMFVHAASSTFGPLWTGAKQLRNVGFSVKTVKDVLYYRVICRMSWPECIKIVGAKYARALDGEAPTVIAGEPALDFVWHFANESIRAILKLLAERRLYKRVFEMRLGELGARADYSDMKTALSPAQRVAGATALQKSLLDQVLNAMRERGPIESISETAARDRHTKLLESSVPLVVLDFPVRGISDELNTPKELGDAVRKYFVISSTDSTLEDNMFEVVRKLQQHMATVRVFAAPEFHELVIRYLNPAEIQACVGSIVPPVLAKR